MEIRIEGFEIKNYHSFEELIEKECGKSYKEAHEEIEAMNQTCLAQQRINNMKFRYKNNNQKKLVKQKK